MVLNTWRKKHLKIYILGENEKLKNPISMENKRSLARLLYFIVGYNLKKVHFKKDRLIASNATFFEIILNRVAQKGQAK